MKKQKIVGLATLAACLCGPAFANNSILFERSDIELGNFRISSKHLEEVPNELGNSMILFGGRVDSAALYKDEATQDSKDAEQPKMYRVSSREELEDLTGESARRAKIEASMQKPGLKHHLATAFNWVGSLVKSVVKTVYSWFSN